MSNFGEIFFLTSNERLLTGKAQFEVAVVSGVLGNPLIGPTPACANAIT